MYPLTPIFFAKPGAGEVRSLDIPMRCPASGSRSFGPAAGR